MDRDLSSKFSSQAYILWQAEFSDELSLLYKVLWISWEFFSFNFLTIQFKILIKAKLCMYVCMYVCMHVLNSLFRISDNVSFNVLCL